MVFADGHLAKPVLSIIGERSDHSIATLSTVLHPFTAIVSGGLRHVQYHTPQTLSFYCGQ
jgi:hypothetical protein